MKLPFLAAAVVLSIATLASTAVAGHVGGPQSSSTSIEPGKKDYYDVYFVRNRPYKITVVGNGQSDLDCFLVDPETGTVLSADVDGTDTCLFYGIAILKRFRVYVKNVGDDVSIYTIQTN